MGNYIFIALVLLFVIGFPVLLIAFCYIVPKKLGYPKIGKYLSVIITSLFILFALWYLFQDKLFTENDAKELLAEEGIILTDDFEIEKNSSSSAIGDYDHRFVLNISERDKKRIVNEIKHTPGFREQAARVETLLYGASYRRSGPVEMQNYETGQAFIREYFKPNGENYAPTFRKITVDKEANKLVFEDVIQ